MGYMSALDMNDQAGCTYQTMQWHLQNNHYPPTPSYMIPFALRAVKYGNKGMFDHRMRVPKETRFRGLKTCTVYQAIESLHLDAFITWQEEEY